MAPKRSLVFAESSVATTAAPKRWVGTAGVEIEGFETPKRAGVAFNAPAGGRVRAKPSGLPNFSRATEAKVRIAVDNATHEHPVEVGFAFYDDSHLNRWEKAVTFEDAGWKTVTLRLPMLSGRGIAPRWDDVSAWGMSFRQRARVKVQSFELWSGGTPTSPEVGFGLLGMAVGEPPSLRAARKVGLALLGDEPAMELESVFDGFVMMHAQVQERFPMLPDPRHEVPVLVLSSQTAFRSFWNVVAGVPTDRGRPRESRYDWMGWMSPQGFSRELRAVERSERSSTPTSLDATATFWSLAEQTAADASGS